MSSWVLSTLVVATIADCYLTLVCYERRYVFVSHPIIPLLIVPPFAFFVTFSSATFSYFLIAMFFSRSTSQQVRKGDAGSRTRPTQITTREDANAKASAHTPPSQETVTRDAVGTTSARATSGDATLSQPARQRATNLKADERSATETGTGTSSGTSNTDGDSEAGTARR